MVDKTLELTSLSRYVPRLSAEWHLHTDEQWREIDGTSATSTSRDSPRCPRSSPDGDGSAPRS